MRLLAAGEDHLSRPAAHRRRPSRKLGVEGGGSKSQSFSFFQYSVCCLTHPHPHPAERLRADWRLMEAIHRNQPLRAENRVETVGEWIWRSK